jgi:hypothetical protein
VTVVYLFVVVALTLIQLLPSVALIPTIGTGSVLTCSSKFNNFQNFLFLHHTVLLYYKCTCSIHVWPHVYILALTHHPVQFCRQHHPLRATCGPLKQCKVRTVKKYTSLKTENNATFISSQKCLLVKSRQNSPK